METTIRILIAFSVQILLAVAWYRAGYSKRGREVQKSTFTFSIFDKLALYVNNTTNEGVVKVKIYDKKLVKFID